MTRVESTPPSLELSSYVLGSPVSGGAVLEVSDPYGGERVGSVKLVSSAEAEAAVTGSLRGGERLDRWGRHEVLQKARSLLGERAEEFATLISLESGLCMRETRYEVGRTQEVLLFAAMEALRDDGETFSCDVSPRGKARKIFTLREPLPMVLAITPFNHPLNQVAHKLAPAIAAGTPTLLKPSEKTPLTAIRFTELLYEAGLPGWMLSTVLGSIDTVVEPLVRDPRVRAISFTGSVSIGKRIAQIAGYKKLCLELGGNSPLIVLEDADLSLAVELAAEGSFRNSGQRCTAVKRLLIQDEILDEFTKQFVEKAQGYTAGDPLDPETRVGTVIDEEAARLLERRVQGAVQQGAKLLLGGERRGAVVQPTVLAHVPREAELVVEESFGPIAPILPVRDLSYAIALANSTAFGLSAGIVTESLDCALRAVREIQTGTVNVNQVPGYRIETSPFGGVKDSGLGVKEGVQEAVRFLSTVKTFSLPW